MTIATERKPVTKIAFAELVAQAVEAERERRSLDTLESRKLSAKAFLRDATANAHTTRERLDRLREALAGPGFDAANRALRQMVKAVQSRNFTCATNDMRRLNYLAPHAAVAELATVQSNALELFALAVLITTEKFPAAFGAVEDAYAAERRFLEVSIKAGGLAARISVEYGPEDTEEVEIDQRGFAKIAFKMSHGQVAIHPRDDAGRRLVAWCLANERETATG